MKITKCRVTSINTLGTDLSIVNAARVSFNKESNYLIDDQDENFLKEEDRKLLCYLAKHKHWSPFAHVFLSFRIKAPIFVARQLAKHQVGLSWNEVSRRYVDTEPEFFLPDFWREKADNIKQGSKETAVMFSKNHYAFIEHNLDYYNYLLKAGVCPEQARMVLPQNMMTEWIWSGSLAAFARICKLRLDPHTQKETQQIAKDLDAYCRAYFPNAWDALMKHEYI